MDSPVSSRPANVRLIWMAVAMALLAGLFLTGCEYFSSPQNTFAPEGEVAKRQKDDFLFVMWPALVVGVLVFAGIIYIAFRYRRKSTDTTLPKQIHGNTALELTWTIIPILLLSVIAVPTVQGIRDLASLPVPEDQALHVRVTGVQWAWLFEYPGAGPNPDEAISAPNVGELVIPVGRTISLEILSNDVNHSFWVPKLAGKTDAIANHPNTMWIRADNPGEFQGQCAEFCGLDHYNMRMVVRALPQEEFDAWLQEQIAEAQPEPAEAPEAEPTEAPAADETPAGTAEDATPAADETPAAGDTPAADGA